MAVFENVLAKEFTDMMNMRKSENTNFSIFSVPYPDLNLITEDSFVDKGRWAYVKGINEKYFSALNNTEVEIVKGRTFQKKLSVLDKETGKVVLAKKSNGEYLTTEITLKKDFVAVYSPIKIKLENNIIVNGVKKSYKPTDGYSYIDFVETPKGKKYLYTIPLETVFPVNLCALVISLNQRKVRYKGCKVALTNGHYIFIQSIPYKFKENPGYVVIGAKTSPNFDKEMKQILDYWMKMGILFDLNLTAVSNQVKGSNNIGIIDIPGSMFDEEYVKYGDALKSYKNVEEYNDLEDFVEDVK